jgi:hypothetical protein
MRFIARVTRLHHFGVFLFSTIIILENNLFVSPEQKTIHNEC